MAITNTALRAQAESFRNQAKALRDQVQSELTALGQDRESAAERRQEIEQLAEEAKRFAAEIEGIKGNLDSAIDAMGVAEKKYETAAGAAQSADSLLSQAEKAHDEARSRLGDVMAYELGKHHEREGARMIKAQKIHWWGIGAVITVTVVWHGLVLAFGVSPYNHLPALPLWAGLMMVWKSLTINQVMHAENEHKVEVLTGAIPVQEQYADHESGYGKVVVDTLKHNPAQRLKTNTEGLWSVLKALVERSPQRQASEEEQRE